MSAFLLIFIPPINNGPRSAIPFSKVHTGMRWRRVALEHALNLAHATAYGFRLGVGWEIGMEITFAVKMLRAMKIGLGMQ